jgi:uncharacterized MAPEG superfamily protein
MSLELKMLALSVVLGLVQILLSAHSASLQVGYRWTATAREARPTLTGVAGRLERALHNFLETFPLFAAAVLLVQVTGRNGPMSAIGAEMYFRGSRHLRPALRRGDPPAPFARLERRHRGNSINSPGSALSCHARVFERDVRSGRGGWGGGALVCAAVAAGARGLEHRL